MRDIWRNIMVHVVPVEQKQYIKKVLLLEELKKLRSQNKICQPIPVRQFHQHHLTVSDDLISNEFVRFHVQRNLKSVEELETYMTYSNILQQLNERELAIDDLKARIKELAQNYDKLSTYIASKLINFDLMKPDEGQSSPKM